MKHCLLTLDYELFGDGSGHVVTHVIEPTSAILSLCESRGVKLTVFFEIAEYWKLKEEWNRGNSMGYQADPAGMMKTQIMAAFKAGHDVQLHLHPQWINAEWRDGQWRLDMSQWRMSDYQGQGPQSLETILKRGKAELESWLQPLDPSYECRCLRAGGYNISPSATVPQAMRGAGLILDTSIVPGAVESGDRSRYNYESIGNRRDFWRFADDAAIADAQGDLIEAPLLTMPVRRIEKYLSLSRIKALLGNSRSARGAYRARTASSSRWGKLRFFLGREHITWDYCLLSKRMHRQFMRLADKLARNDGREWFILVGHPKSLTDTSGLEYLLDAIPAASFTTINTLINENSVTKGGKG